MQIHKLDQAALRLSDEPMSETRQNMKKVSLYIAAYIFLFVTQFFYE